MADDRTQFLIELAAKFSGGDSAVATVATLGDRMLVAGATAKEFEAVTTATSNALEDAAAAALKASDAVASGEKGYAAAETAADKAAKMVELLSGRAQELTGKLQAALDVGDGASIARVEKQVWALAERQQDAVVKTNAAAAALKAEAAAMDVLNSKAASAAAKHDDLKKGLANVQGAADKAAKAELAAAGTGKVNEMAEAFGKLGGPAGVAGQKVLGVATGFKKLGTAMGSAGPYVAMAVAIVAIASAAFVAALAITHWGVSLAEANRSQALLSQGVAQSVQGGAELNAKIAQLSKTVPATRDELLKMAGDLAKTGLRGKDLSDELETAAVKAAKLKFGPDFGRQMLALEVQSRRFDDNIKDTFGGLKVEGLLEGMSTLGDLFDSSTSSGKALKFLFETMFQPLVDGATGVVPKIERMFLYAEIWALKAYIAMKPYRSEIEAVGHALLVGAAAIGGVLAVALGLVIGLFGLLVGIVLDVANGIYELVGAFVDVEKAIYGGLAGAVTFMGELGSNMIKGLVSGITGGATAVVDAMTGVVGGAVDAAKHALGIASESKVLAGLGDNSAHAFASGVEGGTSDAQGALESMVAPPSAPAGAGGSRAGGGGVSVSIGVINVNGESTKEQAHDLIDQFTAWLEGEGITIGGGEVPA
jgi:hypothetical protein